MAAEAGTAQATTNEYSPEDEGEEERHLRDLFDLVEEAQAEAMGNPQYQERLRSAMQNARGSISYVNPRNSNNQEWTINIRDANDAILLRELATGNIENPELLPSGYRPAARLFRDSGGPSGLLVDAFNRAGMLRLLEYQYAPVATSAAIVRNPTYELEITQRNGRDSVRNPISGRQLYIGTRTYKSVFGKMQLRSVEVRPEHLFKTKDYKIDKYCVPSFLKEYLPKKKFKDIANELEANPTPTYPELTNMMNSINIGLNVYIIDGEQIQNQKEQYPKNLDILIRAGHMYVLYKTIYQKTKKTIGISEKEFKDLLLNNDVSSHTQKSVILNQIKYNLEYDNESIFNYNSTFSLINTSFYNSCQIRPTRYFNKRVKHIKGVDLNACYANILRNPNYSIPIQSGREITTEYKGGEISEQSFYYVKFINPDEETKAIFGLECWILGFILKNLGLNGDIIYEHIIEEKRPTKQYGYKKPRKVDNDGVMETVEETYLTFQKATDEELTNNELPIYNYFDIIRETGIMARFRKNDETIYKMKELKDENGQIIPNYEKEALLLKYKCNAYDGGDGLYLTNEHFKKSSAMYAYLGVISYAKYELYKVAKYIRKLKGNCNIAKIQTDYIGFDVMITREDVEKMNKKANKLGFSLKLDFSEVKFCHTEHNQNYVNLNLNEVKEYEESDERFKKLLDKNKSFMISGRGGYGKTYAIKNKIIPHLEATNKKYILASTTKKNAQEIGGIPIQSLLFTKGTNLWKLLEEMKDINYIICDEVSQMTSDTITTLQYLKNEAKINIICSGDINQCESVDAQGESWINSYAFNELVDFKIVNLKWKDSGRYSKEYDEFLDKVIENKNRKKKLNIIYEYFKNQIKESGKEDAELKNIVYTHEKGRSLKTYNTVHSIQGESIDELHNIHEIDRMPPNVLYTALSRTTKKEHVIIVKTKK